MLCAVLFFILYFNFPAADAYNNCYISNGEVYVNYQPIRQLTSTEQSLLNQYQQEMQTYGQQMQQWGNSLGPYIQSQVRSSLANSLGNGLTYQGPGPVRPQQPTVPQFPAQLSAICDSYRN